MNEFQQNGIPHIIRLKICPTGPSISKNIVLKLFLFPIYLILFFSMYLITKNKACLLYTSDAADE